MIFLSTLKIKCYYHSHNHYYPFPSIERDGWSKSDDILKAIWDHLFLNIMSWTLVSHCLLKVDTKFDYVCVTRTAFHSSHISHVWIVLLSCFNTLFTRCLFVFIVSIPALFYLRYLDSHWSCLTSFTTALVKPALYIVLSASVSAGQDLLLSYFSPSKFVFLLNLCSQITSVWFRLVNNPYFNVKLLFVSVRIYRRIYFWCMVCVPK